MRMTDITDYLDSGKIVILDGGIGSELQQRGIELDKIAWSSTANISDSSAVREIHQDYIRAGAQVITTNTYSAAKHVLEAAELEARFEDINAGAVRLAREARDEMARDDVWIAGSISTIPPLNKNENIRVGPEMENDYRQQAEILAEAGVDLLLVEMMLDSSEALTVVDACTGIGLPIWVGLSADLSAEDSTVNALRPSCKYSELGDELFEHLVKNLATADIGVLGVMHTKLEVMAPALQLLSKYWSGPRSAYAEIRKTESSSWEFETDVTPDAYADVAIGWITDYGVQIIGGCCGTRPDHIKALKNRVAELSDVA